MLEIAPTEVRRKTELSDLVEFTSGKRYDVVVSHSGGFTFKRGALETYCQTQRDLEAALQKVCDLLLPQGLFLVNKGEHPNHFSFQNGKAQFQIQSVDVGSLRQYHYQFVTPAGTITRIQQRLALSPVALQELTAPYLKWDFEREGFIVGIKK